MKHSTNQIILSTLIITLVFFLGCGFKLFEKLVWYDKFVHFLAGAWVAILIIWLSKKTRFPSFLKKGLKNHFPFTIITLVFIVGLIWEAFEFGLVQYILDIYKYRSGLQPSGLDTLSDLLTNIVGAGTVAWFLRKK